MAVPSVYQPSLFDLKVCFRCGLTKPLSEFHHSKYSADGYLGRCKECERARNRAGQTGNAEFLSKRRARYRERDYRNTNRRYVAAHRPEYRAYAKEHYWRHRFQILARGANERAAKAGVPGQISAADLERRYVTQNGRCAYCQADLAAGLHTDHKNPLVCGGPNLASNVILACPWCNLKKNRKTVDQYLTWRLAHGLPGFSLNDVSADPLLTQEKPSGAAVRPV